MEYKDHAAKPKMGSEKELGLVFFIFFVVVGLFPLAYGNPPRWWCISIASLFLLIAYGYPTLLKPLNRAWFHLGLLLHKIVSPLILLLIYVVTIVPTALIMRAMKRDPLRLKFEPGLESYWIARTPPGKPDVTMKNQF